MTAHIEESPELTALETHLSGAVFWRGTPGYETARRATCWNARVPDRYPDLIVQAKTEHNVMSALKLAKARGWKVGIRSGGHSWAGNHVRDGGLLLDVSRLKTVTVDRRNKTATVGPGCYGDDVNRVLARHRLFFPVGHCPGVGLGGYLLQGGYGWNSRVLGPACQSVLGIDYVDADGELHHADETQNAEMYWAARGSGPGFFGVVVRYYLKVYPRPKVIAARLAYYPAEHLEALLRWGHQVGPSVPASIELMMLFSRNTPFVAGAGVMVLAPVFADSWKQAQQDTSFMNTLPPGARVSIPLLPFTVSTMTRNVMHHYPDHHHYAVDNMWTDASASELIPHIGRIAQTLPQAPSHLLWMNWTPPESRPDMAYSMEANTYLALYGVWAEAADEAATSQWAVTHMREMAHLAKGIQLADENLGQRPAPFLSAVHRTRLDDLKAAHDPDGRFHSYMGRPE